MASNTTPVFADSVKQFVITGLRANTQHFFLMGGNNLSSACQPNGFNVGDALITNASGGLSFNFYQSNNLLNYLTSLAPSMANLFASALANAYYDTYTGSWLLTDNTASSIASGQFRNGSSSEPTAPTSCQPYKDGTPSNTATAASSTTVTGNANTASNGALANTTSTPTTTSLGTGPKLPEAQCFFLDPSAVQKATEVYITSVDLYCLSKPAAQQNQSGMTNPGVTLWIVPTSGLGANAAPSFSSLSAYTSARREYTEIVPSIDASTPTNFKLATPVPASTGQSYAYVVKGDGNEDFEWWGYKVGDQVVTTGNAAVSMGNQFIGSYFQLGSDNQNWTPLASQAMKFNVNVARFFSNGQPLVANADTFDLHINNFEFIEYDVAGSTGLPVGGEMVYQIKPAPDGYCAAQIGNNTLVCSNALPLSSYYSNPAEPMYIVIDGGSFRNVRQVVSFTNTVATLDAGPSFNLANAIFYATTPVGKVYLAGNSVANNGVRRSLILTNSSANSSVKFANGYNLKGEISGAIFANLSLTSILATDVTPQVALNVPAGSSIAAKEYLGYTTPDNGTTIAANEQSFNVQLYQEFPLPATPQTIVPSRSLEVGLANGSLASTPSNVSVIGLDVTSTNDFTCPVAGANSDVLFTQYYINNDYTGENTKYGNAISKDISTQINLATGAYAQDLIVYLAAYRPPGTDFKVFAKLYNSNDPDAFDDKDWTLLTCSNNSATYSSPTNKNDVQQYTYSLLPSPNTAFTFNGTVTVASGNTTVVAASPIFAANVAVGNLLKFYSPLFANTDYFISSVVSVINSTAITIDTPQSNASLLGTGFKVDSLGFPAQAFSNFSNGNCVRYYDSKMSYHDMYNSFAIKTVFLSSNVSITPYAKSLRGICVTS